MKRWKFSEAQIAFILRQGEEGTAIGEVWRRGCNEERPHNAIGNKAPIEPVNRSAALGPPGPAEAGKNPTAR
jgi:hypothetical protein